MDFNPKKISITIFKNLWKFTGMTSNQRLRPPKSRQDLGFDDQINCALHNCTGFDHGRSLENLENNSNNGIRTTNEGLTQQNPNVLRRCRHPAGDIIVQNITNQQEVIKMEIFEGPQIWERQRF